MLGFIHDNNNVLFIFFHFTFSWSPDDGYCILDMFPRGLKSTNENLNFTKKKMVKESTQKNMRVLKMIMEYKTLLLGYDIDILKFPL